MRTRKIRIEFVGGPIDGKVGRVPVDSLAQFVGYVSGEKEYLYEHAMRPVPPVKGKPFRVNHLYVFLGHDARLPPGVEEF